MGVFKAIVLLSLKPVFLFDRVNCVAIFQTQSLDNVYYGEIQCSWKSNKGRDTALQLYEYFQID